jgi:ATP-dependent DNA ligase
MNTTSAVPFIVERPKFQTVPLADGLQWRGGGGWRYEEKLDGRWHELAIGKSIVVGELMRGGEFFAFDLPFLFGQDMRTLPLIERLAALGEHFGGLRRPITGHGGEFLEAILARGGEGIVAKHLESKFDEPGAWVRCKRSQTEDCVVLEKHPEKMSIRLGQFDAAGQVVERGWCACLFHKFDRVAVGDVVEVTIFGLTPAGKFREPRAPRLRHDKPAADLIIHAKGNPTR